MNMPNNKHDRPTIGILPGWSVHEDGTPDRYLRAVFHGIRSAVRNRGCNLLLAWGLGRMLETSSIHPAWPEVSPNSDFVPVGPWNTDGLIVFAPLLNKSRSRYIQQVIRKGHPVLFIATGEKGPFVSVDNESGIHQAVAHLVDHGHKRIAFIAGDPADLGDSEFRLRSYRSAVVEFDLEADPRLIAYGMHTYHGGYSALQEMLHSGVRFTAMLASDDTSAIGAMKALKEAGLQIPTDVAVMGFDDQPDALAQVPPLSSVHVPLVEIGNNALGLMLEHIEGGVPLESMRISPRLALRQSCGCLPVTILSAFTGGSSQPTSSASTKNAGCYSKVDQQLVDEMVAALASEAQHLDTGARRSCTRLMEAFAESLSSGDPVIFQTTLMDLLQEVELANEDVHAWQEIISILRRTLPQPRSKWALLNNYQFAEGLLHQARVAISESAQRTIYRHQYLEDAAAYRLSVSTARLGAALDRHQAVKILTKYLPEVGIDYARVVIFEPKGRDSVGWSVLIGTDSSPESISQRFPSRQFPPPGLYSSNEPLCLALLPLVFHNEALGYVAYDAGDLDVCTNIARQLAITFLIAQLHGQVVELSLTDVLTGLNNRRYFELFLKNEIKRSHRSKREMALIMIDMDNLKEYNDSFGHPAGDKALQHLAQCLQHDLRKTDVVSRVGGDEFAIILPETDAKGVLEVTEKIRTRVASLSGLKHPITISLGVSLLSEAESGDEAMMQQADQALYQAKREGGDRVHVFHDRG